MAKYAVTSMILKWEILMVVSLPARHLKISPKIGSALCAALAKRISRCTKSKYIAKK